MKLDMALDHFEQRRNEKILLNLNNIRKKLGKEIKWVSKIIRKFKEEEDYWIFQHKNAKENDNPNCYDMDKLSKLLTEIHVTIEFWIMYRSSMKDLYKKNKENLEKFTIETMENNNK